MNHITKEADGIHYFDKHGVELQDGDLVKRSSGRVDRLYLTTEGELGTDATNPAWIDSGRAAPCEYGLYPLAADECAEIEKQ